MSAGWSQLLKANRISVIIIAKKAYETIYYTLKSLISQSRQPDEIIVVIPNTEDPTVDVVKNFSSQYHFEKPKIKIVIEGVSSRESHYASARNIGIDASTGDIIVFINADACAHHEWLRNLDYVFSTHSDILVQQYEIIDVGELPLGLLLFTPSLLLRIRNFLKDFSHNKDSRRLVATIFYAYITYIAFIVEFLKWYLSGIRNFANFLIEKVCRCF
jgi:glycosyltransferase involved in cell wall biosynthesis